MQPVAASSVSARNAAPVMLRDIEDLHDADLDLLLADRLAESADALRAVAAATELAVDVARSAVLHARPATTGRRDRPGARSDSPGRPI